MKNLLAKFFDKTFWKFILVGVANTAVGTAVMFFCYNLLHFDYWLSSALNYIVGSILSFFLNKNFTFCDKSKSKWVVIKFILNILVCYGISYGCAKPLMRHLLLNHGSAFQENAAMLFAAIVFIALNYCGQRWFVFG